MTLSHCPSGSPGIVAKNTHMRTRAHTGSFSCWGQHITLSHLASSSRPLLMKCFLPIACCG